jgi:hypothetical protein
METAGRSRPFQLPAEMMQMLRERFYCLTRTHVAIDNE